MAQRATTPPQSAAIFDSLPSSANCRVETLAVLLDVSENTVWRWAKSGRLPKPYKIGANTTVWNVGEIRASLAALTRRPPVFQ